MAKSVRGQILHLEREQVRAINRGDLRGALKLFDRGFVGFSSTKHQRIRGLGALRKTFDYYLKQPHVSVSSGTAVATFYWSALVVDGIDVGNFLLEGLDIDEWDENDGAGDP